MAATLALAGRSPANDRHRNPHQRNTAAVLSPLPGAYGASGAPGRSPSRILMQRCDERPAATGVLRLAVRAMRPVPCHERKAD
jgi:hypothetical protein